MTTTGMRLSAIVGSASAVWTGTDTSLTVPTTNQYVSAIAPTRWPWLSQVHAACLVLALWLGLLSLAAVAEMTVKCNDGPIFLTADNGTRLTSDKDGTNLVSDQRQRQCRRAARRP